MRWPPLLLLRLDNSTIIIARDHRCPTRRDYTRFTTAEVAKVRVGRDEGRRDGEGERA